MHCAAACSAATRSAPVPPAAAGLRADDEVPPPARLGTDGERCDEPQPASTVGPVSAVTATSTGTSFRKCTGDLLWSTRMALRPVPRGTAAAPSRLRRDR